MDILLTPMQFRTSLSQIGTQTDGIESILDRNLIIDTGILQEIREVQQGILQLNQDYQGTSVRHLNWQAQLESLKKPEGCAGRFIRLLGLDVHSSITRRLARSRFHEGDKQILDQLADRINRLAARPRVQAFRCVASCYSEENGRLYGIGRGKELLPEYYTADRVRKLLMTAFRLPLAIGESQKLFWKRRSYLVTRKSEDKRSVSSLGHLEVLLGKGTPSSVYKVWSFTKGKWIARKVPKQLPFKQDIDYWRLYDTPDPSQVHWTIHQLHNEKRILDIVNQQGSRAGLMRKVGLREVAYGARVRFYSHMRMAPRGSLCKALERGRFLHLSSMERLCMMEPILKGLVHLWDRNICHNDLYDENILIEEDASQPHGVALKIADFGRAYEVDVWWREPIEKDRECLLTNMIAMVIASKGQENYTDALHITFALLRDQANVKDKFDNLAIYQFLREVALQMTWTAHEVYDAYQRVVGDLVEEKKEA